MESLPELHPVVLKSISSPPFEYCEKGLTFRGHVRESIADLESWLYPRRRNAQPPDKTIDWWMAQLRLLGIRVADRMLKVDVMDKLKAAVRGGLSGPPQYILQLEKTLERKFLLKNAEARDKEYEALDEGGRAAKYSERYLREKFFNGKNGENVIVLQLHEESYAEDVHAAARKLGLHSEDAFASRRRSLIIVDKDLVNVLDEVSIWEQEYLEWNEERIARKREEQREIREMNKLWRQQYEAVGVGSFEDVAGEWEIECPSLYEHYGQFYRKSEDRCMSIYFGVYVSEDSGVSEEEDTGGSDSEENAGLSEVGSSQEKVTSDESSEDFPRMLCANLDFGILTGVLRARYGLPALSSSFPTPWLPFTWRYRDTFEGAYIQFDNETGYLKFVSKTRLKGKMQGWSFVGRKIDNDPANLRDEWENFCREQYEFENVRRWGGRWPRRRKFWLR